MHKYVFHEIHKEALSPEVLGLFFLHNIANDKQANLHKYVYHVKRIAQLQTNDCNHIVTTY